MSYDSQHQGANPNKTASEKIEAVDGHQNDNLLDPKKHPDKTPLGAHLHPTDVSNDKPNMSKIREHHHSPQKYPTTWQAMQSAKQEIPDQDLIDIQHLVTEVSGSSVIPLLEIADSNDPGSILRIGRWGEEFVSTVLQRRGKLPDGRLIVSVDWVNQSEETGKPYDIIVELECRDGTNDNIYIEVKSTSSNTKDVVDFSWNELKFAEKEGKNYHLYRVYNAGRATHRLCRLENLSSYLHNGPVRLLFLL